MQHTAHILKSDGPNRPRRARKRIRGRRKHFRSICSDPMASPRIRPARKSAANIAASIRDNLTSHRPFSAPREHGKPANA